MGIETLYDAEQLPLNRKWKMWYETLVTGSTAGAAWQEMAVQHSPPPPNNRFFCPEDRKNHTTKKLALRPKTQKAIKPKKINSAVSN